MLILIFLHNNRVKKFRRSLGDVYVFYDFCFVRHYSSKPDIVLINQKIILAVA